MSLIPMAPMSAAELAASLVRPDEKPDAETTVSTPAEGGETVSTQEGEVAADEAAATQGSEAKPKPGTPDKALQKLQQQQASIDRNLQKLADKIDAGETLSAEERKQVQKNQRKLEVIREAMKTGFDIVDHGSTLVEGLVETDDEVQTLKHRLDKLERGTQESSDQASWGQVRKDYAGVDVDAVWSKALEDAEGLIGKDNPAVRKLASKYLHERCSAAAKRKEPPKPEGKPKVTPGGGRVSLDGAATVAPEKLSDAEKYKQTALSLVVEDE